MEKAITCTIAVHSVLKKNTQLLGGITSMLPLVLSVHLHRKAKSIHVFQCFRNNPSPAHHHCILKLALPNPNLINFSRVHEIFEM